MSTLRCVPVLLLKIGFTSKIVPINMFFFSKLLYFKNIYVYYLLFVEIADEGEVAAVGGEGFAVGGEGFAVGGEGFGDAR